MQKQSAQTLESEIQKRILQDDQKQLASNISSTTSADLLQNFNISTLFKPNPSNNQKRSMLTLPEAHFGCYKDLYSKDTNPNGYVPLGVSVNILNMKNIVKIFPSYLKPVNCEYTHPLMEDKFNQILSKNTPYKGKQTFGLNNLAAIINIHAQMWKQISIEGEYPLMNAIESYSRCSIVPFENSKCHFLFYPTPQQIEKYLAPDMKKRVLIVISNLNEILPTDKPNIFYAYEKNYMYGILCGVCHYKDKEINSLFYEYFSQLILLSTFIIATIIQIEEGGLTKQDKNQLELIEKQKNVIQSFEKMLNEQEYQLDRANIYFGCGVTGTLIGTSCSVFQKGDRVQLDYPYYPVYFQDTLKAGIVLNTNDLDQETIKEKAERAYNQGSKGYIICNPHNPTGKVYEPKQIIEVCEWAKTHPNFHLIVDEIYYHSIHCDSVKIFSAIQYSNRYENIHTLRGLGKDYSLCGFKVGMLISCNSKIRVNYPLWKDIIYPQQFMLKTASRLLKKTNFGSDLLIGIKTILQKANMLTLKLLDHFGIKYIYPKAGCFVILDFRSLLKSAKINQTQLWIKIYHEYKINISKGSVFGFKEEGYFRFCHIVNEEYILEAIQRLKLMVNELTSKKQ